MSGPRGTPVGMWLGWSATFAAGMLVARRWNWLAGVLTFALLWAVAKPIIRAFYRRRG